MVGEIGVVLYELQLEMDDLQGLCLFTRGYWSTFFCGLAALFFGASLFWSKLIPVFYESNPLGVYAFQVKSSGI